MNNFIKNNKYKKNIKLIIILVVVFGFVGGGILISKKGDPPKKLVDIRIPITYDQPLVIANFGSIFSIQPINASTSAKATVDKQDSNIVKYIDAYQNTDVVQTKYSNKLKEDIVLKKPGHPDKFIYQIDVTNYDFIKNEVGDFIFYQKGHIKNELYKVFVIPAPFMIDANNNISENEDVKTELTNEGLLVLEPSQEWLGQANYPVILDPTIEIHILNIQSYPKVGGPWDVRFVTVGEADLSITGLSHDDYNTVFDQDVSFISLKCGDDIKEPIWDEANNSYYFNDWVCDQEANFEVTVLEPGKHHLQFDFGGVIANAYNNASGFTDPTSNGSGSTCLNPTNAFSSDDSDAGCNPTLGYTIIDVDNFGFDITSNDIAGIEVRVEAAVNNSGAIYYLSCQLLDASGSAVGDSKNTSNWTSTSDVSYTIGGAADMWGTSLTEADIEDTDFGVRCTAVKSEGTDLMSLLVDNIDIQITYGVDVYSALYQDSDYWDGTTSWGGYASQGERDAHYTGGGFTSILAWVEDRDGNSLAENHEVLEVIGSWSSALTETAHYDIDDFNAGSIEIITLGDARHEGKWDATKFIWDMSSYYVDIELASELNGLQVQGSATTRMIEYSTGGDSTVDSCIFKTLNGGGTLDAIMHGVTGTFDVYNSVFFDGSVGQYAIDLTDDGVTFNLYNSVIQGFAYGVDGRNLAATTIKNNAVYDNGDDFQYITNATVDYNASDDGDGTNSVQPADWSTVFVDAANGDFHLKATDTDLMDAGIGPSSDANVATADIDDDARSGATCDIGADEYVAAAVPVDPTVKIKGKVKINGGIMKINKIEKEIKLSYVDVDYFKSERRILNLSIEKARLKV